MLFNAPPPSLPVPIYSQDDCKKGSRDCFPDNTQGGAVEEISSVTFFRNLSGVSHLAKAMSSGAYED